MKKPLFLIPFLLFSCWYEQDMSCCDECTETVIIMNPDAPKQTYENILTDYCQIDSEDFQGVPNVYPDWKGRLKYPHLKDSIKTNATIQVKYSCKGCVFDRTKYRSRK
jgi:hypothetical protein